MFRKILLATHGTEGAKEAEGYAIELAKTFNSELHALYVIHKGWGSLIGIEWLHPSHTRMDFYKYTETELFRRAKEVLQDFQSRSTGIEVVPSVIVGDPVEIIANEAKNKEVDLVIIGDKSNDRSEEYKARISLKKLLKLAPCPVFVAKNNTGSFIKIAPIKN